jgi:hypothetical protein
LPDGRRGTSPPVRGRHVEQKLLRVAHFALRVRLSRSGIVVAAMRATCRQHALVCLLARACAMTRATLMITALLVLHVLLGAGEDGCLSP